MDIKISGAAPGKGLDLAVLEAKVKPLGFIIKKSKRVNGVLELDITKSVKGADNSVTITENMSPDEVKRLLKFVETGSLPSKAKQKGTINNPYIYIPQ
jgi:phosphoribosylanthranilate isomerase